MATFLLFLSLVAHAATNPEVESYLQAHPGIERADAERRLELFHLAVQEAKRQGWDKDAKTQRDIDKAIYASYLRHIRAKTLEPTENELRKAYEAEPLVRLRLLTLRGNNTAKLEELRARWKAGASFEKLVLENSEDTSRNVGGDLDFRGPQNLPTRIYAAARQLKKNEVSGVIQTPNAVHLVQLIDTRPFASADATYLAWLRGRLRSEREQVVLSASLAELKKNSRR